MQVGAAVTRAGRATAFRIERFIGEFVHAAARLQVTARSEGAAALRHLRGNDAIEHVDSAMHGFEDVERCTDAHQVTRLVVRQKRGGELADLLALFLPLAYC